MPIDPVLHPWAYDLLTAACCIVVIVVVAAIAGWSIWYAAERLGK